MTPVAPVIHPMGSASIAGLGVRLGATWLTTARERVLSRCFMRDDQGINCDN